MSRFERKTFTVATFREARAVRLSLSGELDLATVDDLNAALDAAEHQRPENLILDLSALSFLDATGLRTILLAARRAHREGRQFQVINPIEHVRRLFELTCIERTVDLAPAA